MYTASIQALNEIMAALSEQHENGCEELYDLHYEKYQKLYEKLYENLEYYKGTYGLISYTQTKNWAVYGVNRSSIKGKARVDGINNVYDDQQWLIIELLETYKHTSKSAYLERAEYLTSYVLDGWDSTLDADGNEHGGITWGPGYVTKHACSNGPMIGPLVELYNIYKDKNDIITYRLIDTNNNRITTSDKKSDYYLNFAKKIYQWQKSNLLRFDGVYDDFMGGCDPYCDVRYETINNEKFRMHNPLRNKVGPAYSYNTGTMISGAAYLYSATNEQAYYDDLERMVRASFGYFAKKDQDKTGYHTYDVTGFNNWFNSILMRGYVDAVPYFGGASVPISTFQENLDYAYDNYLKDGMLPPNLLLGWSFDGSKNSVEAMFTFAFAAEYASLSRYEIEKTH